ncbi:hypothetical protein JVT61DRAFT_6310 [Boletus reticuloceps]|uniref:Uncharacterized protein n=1 Tax=Boletus reticuloceps TaxID=495285 RepID=A0A8I2YKY4_9AGAM|nr:hypothetical protein JVT61DRAFT_6310 [Boletus reticuloceps]
MALVHKLTAELTLLKDKLHLSDDDFPRFLAEERSYLLSVKCVPPQDGVKIRYVQSLDELVARKVEWNAAREVAIGALNSLIQGDQNTIASVLNAAHIRIDLAYTRLQNTEALVAHFQQLLGLESAWEVGGDEYNQYKEEATLGKYREALGELERLVVMRLFELAKLSLSGTGYKLRQQISKNLQRRSQTIRKAIAEYNVQASRLVPPRPSISWKQIVEYTSLGEFDLLRHTRDDVRDRIWAKPAVREATAKFFKLCRAKEEIIRLNVEIRRLRTAIHDEEEEVSRTIASMHEVQPLLAAELRRRHQTRAAVNAIHLYRLNLIEEQYGLARRGEIGTRATLTPTANGPVAQSSAEEDEPVRETNPSPSRDEPAHTDSYPALDELYNLYINDPGDDQLVEDDEHVADVQEMAEFLHNIID